MKNLKGIAYALASSSTFGLIPLFSIPILVSGAMEAPSLLFYRFAFATLAMGLAGILLKKDFRVSPRLLLKISLLGVFYASTSMGLTLSYQYIPSGVATTIHFLYPVVVTVIMTTFFGESARVRSCARLCCPLPASPCSAGGKVRSGSKVCCWC